MTTLESERPPTLTSRRAMGWREIAVAYAFYFGYSRVRGSGRSSSFEALRNARTVIEWERALAIYHEHSFQRTILASDQIVVALNSFYGLAHFVVTPAVAVFLFRKRHDAYRQARNVLAWTTGLALIGYYVFPLMPPRLVPGLGFTDTMVTHASAWRLTPIPIWNVGNPYAAMPSLHVGWSLWVCFALLVNVENPVVRLIAKVYPVLTLIAIVGTGNHFVLDAVGGALVFGAATLIPPALQGALSRSPSAPRPRASWPNWRRPNQRGSASHPTATCRAADSPPL